jgi:putative ABC transport system ATP-binding protein
VTDHPCVVRVRNLSKTFQDGIAEPVHAVRDVSFDVRVAEVTLITGSSGSGKTTLLSLLGGLIPPTSGDVELLGQPLRNLSQAALTHLRLHSIGYVFQAFRLIDALSVTENVELALNIAGVMRPGSRMRAVQLLEQFGLGARLGFRPAKLSAGEKQRVAIARALANDPPLILADEPTGSLDSRSGHRVIETLRDAAHLHGRAVLIVSHDPRIRGYADHVFEMEDGRLSQPAPVVPVVPG